MSQKRELATRKFANEVASKADNYGGGPMVQSLLNYLKQYGEGMVEAEKENIKKAFEDGFYAGMETFKRPFYPPELYYDNTYEKD